MHKPLISFIARSCLLVTFVAAGYSAAPNTSGQVTGRTLYIDSEKGNDNNPGFSPDKAWKTLNRANLFELQPGDSLLLKAGTRYSGQLKPQGSGKVDGGILPVIVGKYGHGPAPRIDAEGKFPAPLELFNVQGYEISDLELTNNDPGKKPKHWGAYVHIEEFGKASHIRLARLYIHDVHGNPYKDKCIGGGVVWANSGTIKPTFFDDLRIEECHIQDCERDGIRGIGIDCNRETWHPSLNVVIRKNRIERIPGDAIVVKGCDGALVEYNICCDFVRPPGLGTEGGTVSAGIWPNGSDNTLIQYNEVSGHKSQQDGQGFDSDFNCRNTIFQYNYSHDNEGGFMLICNPGDVKMPKNFGNDGTIVRYNVSINDGIRAVGKSIVHASTFHFGGSPTHSRIYNNTIIVPTKADQKIDNSIVFSIPWGGGIHDDTLFANNIIYVVGTTKYTWGKDKLMATNCRFDGNLYVGTHQGVPKDPHAIFADPLFVNLQTHGNGWEFLNGLKLRANSPAIGRGIPVLNQEFKDFSGAVVPRDRHPTIGAFQ